MKTTSLNLSQKHPSRNNQLENPRKQKNFYEQFLQLLIRKTEAEKRAQIFGMDPFK
jgi:hypothetical protein